MNTTYYVTKEFWIKASERALRTFGQAAVGAIGVATAAQSIPEINGINWVTVLSITGLTTLLSFLNSIASPEAVMTTDTSVPTVDSNATSLVLDEAVQSAITAHFANHLQATPAPEAKSVPAEIKAVVDAPTATPAPVVAEPAVEPVATPVKVEAPVLNIAKPVVEAAPVVVEAPVVEPVAVPAPVVTPEPVVETPAPVVVPVPEVVAPAAPEVAVTLTKDELIAQLTARLAALEAVPTPGATVEAPLGYITGKNPEQAN